MRGLRDSAQVLALLDRPTRDEPYKQFTLRDRATMPALRDSLNQATEPQHVAILANAIRLRHPVGASCVKALLNHMDIADVDARSHIVEALIGLRAKTACAEVKRRLTVERSHAVRSLLIEAVGACCEDESLSLIAPYLSDPRWQMRYRAAFGLVWLASPEAAGALRAALESETDPIVRGALERALTSSQPVSPRG